MINSCWVTDEIMKYIEFFSTSFSKMKRLIIRINDYRTHKE